MEGFEEFVRGRSASLLRQAYLLCAGDRAAAEDLLQDVLERMYVRWRGIHTEPEPYARAALANAAGSVEGPERGTAERDAAGDARAEHGLHRHAVGMGHR